MEKKICDVEAKMAAPLSTMKFWKPGKSKEKGAKLGSGVFSALYLSACAPLIWIRDSRCGCGDVHGSCAAPAAGADQLRLAARNQNYNLPKEKQNAHKHTLV